MQVHTVFPLATPVKIAALGIFFLWLVNPQVRSAWLTSQQDPETTSASSLLTIGEQILEALQLTQDSLVFSPRGYLINPPTDFNARFHRSHLRE